MLRLSLRNLLVRRMRSALSLLGMAIAIVLVIGLISFSIGLRQLIGHSMGELRGLQIVRDGSPDPILSTLESAHLDSILAVPGVRHVTPEVWHFPMVIEDKLAYQGGMESTVTLIGIDPARTRKLETARIYLDNMVAGRYLKPEDEGRVAVVSRQIAENYGKSVGDSLRLGDQAYEIVGI